MKRITALIITTITLSLSGQAMAIFGWSQWQTCENEGEYGSSYCSTCQCTEPNYGMNDCTSQSQMCEAFGNVGQLR